MNRAGDDLFAGAGFTLDQNRGSGGSREFHLGQGAAQDGAVADNFFKVELGPNFLFEIEFLDGEFVF